MSLIFKKHISPGIIWVAIEEADLYICCGCPADTAKHLKKAGVVNRVSIDGQDCEDGPNAILLSDVFIQNGQIANLAEFPMLQMLYLQGMNVPNHPNYQKNKPILIGYENQIDAQLSYISLGNHGLSDIEEIMEAGISPENADKIFATKLHYSGGEIKNIQELVASCIIGEEKQEIKNGVFIHRTGINKFKISYKDEWVYVDLNLHVNEHFSAPYELPFREVKSEFFSITHSGEGNGWDKNRPCMASLIHNQDKIYLIDAGPNILSNLSYLGIGLSEIDGIFLTHIHDDHFAGITELLNVERKLNLYTTKLIRRTAEKKLRALMNSEIDLLHVAFNCIDLEFNMWNGVNGMQVQPIYSPHTVETNIFNFRVFDGQNHKIYSHLADTINFKEFKIIIDKSPEIFAKNEFEILKDRYLSKVNLKKIDVGGGLIHGHLSDYKDDQSDLLVMAHTSSVLESDRENVINVNFGDSHPLILKEDFNLLKSKSLKFLKKYFNTLEDEQLDLLVNQKISRFEPGQVVGSVDEEQKKLMLILSGLVYYENNDGIQQTIDARNFIGFSRRYFRNNLPDKYMARSYVYCLEFDELFFNQFILRFDLIGEFNARLNIIKILRESRLIHECLSNSVNNRISKYTEIVRFDEHDLSDTLLKNSIFILINGMVKVEFDKGRNLTIHEHEHFGGTNLMKQYRRKQNYIFTEEITALSIPIDLIEKVPKLLWRLIEMDEKRYQLSIFAIN